MNMPFGRKSPLEALALPGIILAYKYSQFRQRRREAASRRVTERELSALHNKIDKLLHRLDDTEPDPPTSQENECVICINARATMQTSPCGHCVVCRRCFVKTIQSAVAQRLLPLRCVICRARINRLSSISGNWHMQESANGYIWTGKGRLTTSASEYKMPTSASNSYIKGVRHGYARSNSESRWYVSNSASLYSMSSTGSHTSRTSASSKTSSTSSCALSSPCTTPLSNNTVTFAEPLCTSQKLAPPVMKHTRSLTLPTSSSSLRGGAHSPKAEVHSHCSGCPSNCSGAVPRKPRKTQLNNNLSSSHTVVTFSNPMTQTYPGRRSSRARASSLKSHLPPIEEFRSPAKAPYTSPVHINNPRFRYASYTKSNTGFDTAPFLCDTTNKSKASSGSPHFKGSGAKICPTTSKENLPKMAFLNSNKTNNANGNKKQTANTDSNNINKKLNSNNNNNNTNKETTTTTTAKGDINCHENNTKPLQSDMKASASFFNLSAFLVNYKLHFQHSTSSSSSSRKNLTFLFKSNHKEKADNKNNEAYERKKKEEKLKQKVERDTRKEEKRKAKDEDRLAKAVAKEDKKLAKNK